MSILGKLLPSSIKTAIGNAIQKKVVEPTLKFRFGKLYESQTSIIKYAPYKRDEDYCIPNIKPGTQQEPLPRDYYLGYANSEEEYYETGKKDLKAMNDILLSIGYTERTQQAVLDLGCGSARMLKNLNLHFKDSELWGTDISAGIIYWCKVNLADKANFATTTLIPHLPFESNYFNLIYCGSVFTHIDDLAEAWMLEVRRVLKKGGIFYVTIGDENTIKMLENECKDHFFAKYVNTKKIYLENKHSFGMMVMDRDNNSQVFFSREYFTQMVSPVFEVVRFVDAAYGYQSVAVLRKK